MGVTRRNVQTADEAFLVFEDIEGIADGGAIFEGYGTTECVRFEKAFDEIESAAVVPVQLVTPVGGFFLQERLKLAHGSLTEVNDVHGRVETGAPLPEESIIAGKWM